MLISKLQMLLLQEAGTLEKKKSRRARARAGPHAATPPQKTHQLVEEEAKPLAKGKASEDEILVVPHN